MPGIHTEDAPGGGGVSSVFGRTGTVAAASSDYDASQIDNDSILSGATVKDVLDNHVQNDHVDTVGPTASNDGVDTAALGKAFQIFSRWQDSVTGCTYICKSNATGAAVWQSIGKAQVLAPLIWRPGTPGPASVIESGLEMLSFADGGTVRQAIGQANVPADVVTQNPVVFGSVIVTAAGAGDGVARFDITTRYTGSGELINKSADQTLSFDVSLVNTLWRRVIFVFTLDKTLISPLDQASIIISRAHAHANDTFTGSAGIARRFAISIGS